MTSTHKKVQILRFGREPASGVVNPQTYLRPEGVEMITPAGAVAVIPYREVKAVCFVRDFGDPEELIRKRVFSNRPKLAGLWVRLVFRDSDTLEGVVSSNLLQIEAEGLTVAPPDQHANAQKLFIPRAALKEAQVIGVIGVAKQARKRIEKAASGKPVPQLDLFEGR